MKKTTASIFKANITRRVVLCALVSLFLTACDTSQQSSYQPRFSPKPNHNITIYRFGVHPLHNPTLLHAIFNPIMEILNKQITGVQFKLEASRNYASFDKKLYAGEFHFALPNPYQTINAIKHGYHVFGKMGDDQNFRGIILVRKDSDIHTLTDLKGKAVSFPAATALAATMMPQFYMQQHGLNVMHDIKIKYVGSQESSIMNVYLGNTGAAATWPPPWRAFSKQRPDIARALTIKWQTESLPNNSLVARDDMPATLVQQVAAVFFSLQKNTQGRAILNRMQLTKFEPADNQTYLPVKKFIDKFNHQVRPIQ